MLAIQQLFAAVMLAQHNFDSSCMVVMYYMVVVAQADAATQATSQLCAALLMVLPASQRKSFVTWQRTLHNITRMQDLVPSVAESDLLTVRLAYITVYARHLQPLACC